MILSIHGGKHGLTSLCQDEDGRLDIRLWRGAGMALEALKALFKLQAQHLSWPNSAELQESEMF